MTTTTDTKQITLANLHDATAQQVFDQVARHLLTQGEKAVTAAAGSCVYRTPQGLTCAAGCLISRSEYDAMKNRERITTFGVRRGPEGIGWWRLIELEWVSGDHKGLIGNLQSVHDDFGPDRWRDCLQHVAIDHDLSPAVLDEFPEPVIGKPLGAVICDEIEASA